MASALTAAAILSGGGFLPPLAADPQHVLQSAKETVWAPAPLMLPRGAEIAVVSGDPGKAEDAPSNKTLTRGGYALMPAKMNHFAYATKPTTIIVYGIGPVDFKYVNPSDDPRNSSGSK